MPKNSFPPFRPHPLLVGGHAQTLAGVYLPWPYAPYGAVRHHVVLDDGDQLVVHDDRPTGWRDGDPACVLVHGLGGGFESGYMRRITAKLLPRGVRMFRMDMRACGAGEGLAGRTTHCGRWHDVATVVEFVSGLAIDSPVALVGFSLGGTISLNLAAEIGAGSCGNLVGLLAVCSPIELHSVRKRFRAPTGRPYDRHFVRALWQTTVRQMRERPDFLPLDWTRPPRRLREYDELITAPLAGFASVDEYYTQTSPGPRLAQIRLPTTIIAAADDPVVPIEPLKRARHGDALEVHITRCGGHLGYIGKRGHDPDGRWMDWRVVDWVTQTCPSSTRTLRVPV